ncbi:MAG: fatty acid desaturase family protein [Acidimicrobiia bacterium]|nr:fatty acid desaturase family protein [Acidimicrobiia bacterium]
MAATMVPPADVLPDVLPTERLTASGMPVPAVRAELRRIASVRNIGAVAFAYAQAGLTIAAAFWLGHPLGYLAAVVLMGPVHARFAILAHEAAHKLLFRNKSANDLVGRWLLAYPAFVPFEAYRRAHCAHHREEFGPHEPDLNLYVGYPVSRASLRRKLGRDAAGISGWKNLKLLGSALTKGSARPVAMRILGAQAVLATAAVVAGRWWVYQVLWLVPWSTSWRVVNRLRAIAEHGGMERSADRRRTTHHVRQSWLARFWIVPCNTGWHLAHHVDIGVPFRHLPALHAELVAAGWVPTALEWPSYRALWRALGAGEDRSGVVAARSPGTAGFLCVTSGPGARLRRLVQPPP